MYVLAFSLFLSLVLCFTVLIPCGLLGFGWYRPFKKKRKLGGCVAPKPEVRRSERAKGDVNYVEPELHDDDVDDDGKEKKQRGGKKREADEDWAASSKPKNKRRRLSDEKEEKTNQIAYFKHRGLHESHDERARDYFVGKKMKEWFPIHATRYKQLSHVSHYIKTRVCNLTEKKRGPQDLARLLYNHIDESSTLELFVTHHRGLGIRAKVFIPADTVLDDLTICAVPLSPERSRKLSAARKDFSVITDSHAQWFELFGLVSFVNGSCKEHANMNVYDDVDGAKWEVSTIADVQPGTELLFGYCHKRHYNLQCTLCPQ